MSCGFVLYLYNNMKNAIMMKYPIGIQSFDRIIEDGYVYVDKTDLIYSLVKEGTIYFLSRPRRFGKSLLVSTIENYFLGRKELFKGLKIDAMEQDWLEYPVFHVDFNSNNFLEAGTLERKLEGYVETWERIYGGDTAWTNLGDRFASVLKRAHELTGRRCVVLVDEYDKPILDVLGMSGNEDGESLESRNRNVLKGFYSVFKAADSDFSTSRRTSAWTVVTRRFAGSRRRSLSVISPGRWPKWRMNGESPSGR